MQGINGNKIRQNMQNQKDFQVKKTKNLDQLNKAASSKTDKDHNGAEKNKSGQPSSTQPTLEVNKTGNTVYINGFSSGSNQILKNSSNDMSGKD